MGGMQSGGQTGLHRFTGCASYFKLGMWMLIGLSEKVKCDVRESCGVADNGLILEFLCSGGRKVKTRPVHL